jgi:hypothetical protein
MIFWWRRCIEQSRSPSQTARCGAVGQHLDLDVARVLEELLHVDGRVAEGRAGLGAGGLHRVDQRRLGVHHAHAAPAAAAGGLDDHRVADAAGDADDLLRVVGQGAFRARHAGHAGLDHGLLGRPPCRPSVRIDSGVGPMKTKPLFSTRSAKSAFSDRKP